MDENILKITDEQMRTNSARLKKEGEIKKASDLEKDQIADAKNLLELQSAHPTANMKDEQGRAADKLRREQNKAADALKTSENEGASALKKAAKRFAQKISERNQIIEWLAGGYSKQPDQDK